MLRSNAGKARVSVVWIVVLGVLFLISVVLAFLAQSDVKKGLDNVTTAQAEVSKMTAQVEQATTERKNISAVLGWYDRASADPKTDPEAAKKALEELKNTFPDLGAAEKDFESSLPKILAAVADRDRKNAELETRIKGLESELTAAQAATTQVTSDKDATIATLRQQVADEQKNAEQSKKELESRLEQGRGQLTERDNEVRKAREDAALEKRRFEQQKAIDDARMAQLSNDLRLPREPFWNEPDGKVLEVSERLGTGWIDLGANQRVVRGMVFEVRSGRPGQETVKAHAEVTGIKSDSAEVLFTDIADPYSPPVKGDVISNRLYDRAGGRNAVLVGRFSGTFNEKDLASLLAKMGIQVQPKVDKTTHFLIVGSELWNDPATGEPLAEPMPASDLPEYKQAESLAVQIVPLQDIREYFRLGAGQ